MALEARVDPGIAIDGDPVRLAQVFSNLLLNAAKFTPPGGSVRVSAAIEDGEAVARVRDDGAGIPPESLGAIFEMFAQTPAGAAAGGLGIGLALVRQLAELHGGSASAASEGPGRGSEFALRLPLARDEASADAFIPPSPSATLAAARARTAPTPKDVLVVDDNADAADSLADAVRLRGHRARVAYGGDEALAACELRLPDVVVMDIGMPGRDGHATAREIAARWAGPSQPTMAALTGWGQPEDRRRSAEAGFQRHFTKPADLDELMAALGL